MRPNDTQSNIKRLYIKHVRPKDRSELSETAHCNQQNLTRPFPNTMVACAFLGVCTGLYFVRCPEVPVQVVQKVVMVYDGIV